MFLKHPKGYLLRRTKEGESGSLVIDSDAKIFYINYGKVKDSEGALQTVIRKVAFYCLQLNTAITVTVDFYQQFKTFIEDNLLNVGIEVIVYGTD